MNDKFRKKLKIRPLFLVVFLAFLAAILISNIENKRQSQHTNTLMQSRRIKELAETVNDKNKQIKDLENQILEAKTMLYTTDDNFISPTINWRTYVNNKMGIKLIYPQNWELQIEEDNNSINKSINIMIRGSDSEIKLHAYSLGGGVGCSLKNGENIITKDSQYVAREIIPVKSTGDSYVYSFCGGEGCIQPAKLENQINYCSNHFRLFKLLPSLQALSYKFNSLPNPQTVNIMDKIVASFEDISSSQ